MYCAKIISNFFKTRFHPKDTKKNAFGAFFRDAPKTTYFVLSLSLRKPYQVKIMKYLVRRCRHALGKSIEGSRSNFYVRESAALELGLLLILNLFSLEMFIYQGKALNIG